MSYTTNDIWHQASDKGIDILRVKTINEVRTWKNSIQGESCKNVAKDLTNHFDIEISGSFTRTKRLWEDNSD